MEQFSAGATTATAKFSPKFSWYSRDPLASGATLPVYSPKFWRWPPVGITPALFTPVEQLLAGD
jgi:hypothetical protein